VNPSQPSDTGSLEAFAPTDGAKDEEGGRPVAPAPGETRAAASAGATAGSATADTADTAEQPVVVRARPAPAARRVAGGVRGLAGRLHVYHLGLAGVLALSAVLNTYRLSQNGFANTFYSAAVKSMLLSLHNFVFVSFDPGGLISVDKPPLALWLQTASAKAFGFAPLSLLLPEAILSVIAVGVLYLALTRRLGPAPALLGSLAMAVFPSFVAVSRENGVDPLLILLMVLACAAVLSACETGHWRTLLAGGVFVALAFNTKTLAALLVLPGIALAYLLCAPGSLRRRIVQLVAAGALMTAVSLSWMVFVDATPASKRPYVGSSTNNSELGLTFGYNGFGRVEGQTGGPGEVPFRAGARIVLPHRVKVHHVHRELPPLPNNRARSPTPFGGPLGPLRLFDYSLGGQAGWIVPFAFFGMIALAALLLVERRGREPQGRRDPRLAVLLAFGSWFLIEAAVMSFSKGIVHPYYSSALAPGVGAMTAAGSAGLVGLSRKHGWLRVAGLALASLAVLATLVVQAVLLEREDYLRWFIPLLLAGGAAGVGAMVALRSAVAPGMAVAACALLIAPGAFASTTWEVPVEGTFPAAGPKAAGGAGGIDVARDDLGSYYGLKNYIDAHKPVATRFELLTDSAPTAAPWILLGMKAASLAGYSGTDPAVDGPRLAGMVERGEARFVLLGGEFSSRGGNRATAAVLHACKVVNPQYWKGPEISPYSVVLFDCAGRARGLTGS
jgi:4-amino-4-deoxy-L-arabinose transferase-like glycosyltransferase